MSPPAPPAGRTPFAAWPGWPLLRLYARLHLEVLVLFVVVFGAAEALAVHRVRHRVDFAWEAGLPLVPAFTWVYMSIYLPLLGAPFVLRSTRELRALAAAARLTILVAGACFVLAPVELGYPPLPELGDSLTARVFRLADLANLRYNLVPSLHVGLSSVALGALATRARPAVRVGLGAWALAIGVSTLLTHQHHLVDALAGFGVAGLGLGQYQRSLRAPE